VEEVLRLEGLQKAFGAHTVLSGFDLVVGRGECVGLLGPNGAGKTTTMKLITGQARLDGGRMTVLGHALPAESRAARSRMGVVTQDNTLDEELNCIRNLIIHAGFFGIPSATAHRRAESLLAFVDLQDKREAKVQNLSGGMRQRLLIARALINEPELLLLDEPTTGLDPQARQNVWQKIRDLKRRGTTVLLTTHYMDEAEQLCDRLVLLDRGQVLNRGRPAELIDEVVGREVVELRRSGASAVELAESLPLEGLEHESFSDTLFVFLRAGQQLAPLPPLDGLEHLHRRATLEDVFLRRTGRELRE